jgi:DNA polymerase-3 subunit beta
VSDLIDKTLFAASTDSSRVHLWGCYLKVVGGAATMVGIDGGMLAVAKAELAAKLNADCIIPRLAVQHLVTALDGHKGSFGIAFSGTPAHLFARIDGVNLALKLTDAQYPPYENVIPKSIERTAVVPRAALIMALKRVSMITSELKASSAVNLTLSAGALRIKGENPDLGESEDEIEVQYDAPEITIGAKADQIVDAIKRMDTDEVLIQLVGDMDPITIKPKDRDDYTFVTMPMRK